MVLVLVEAIKVYLENYIFKNCRSIHENDKFFYVKKAWLFAI